MRSQVQELVHQFIYESLEISRYGLVVDGRDISGKSSTFAETLKQMENNDVEPFNQELNDDLREAYALVDELTLDISNLRQKFPNEILKIFTNSTISLGQFNDKNDLKIY